MEKHDRVYETYLQILKEELIPAFGCTEPIAIALAAASARQLLEGEVIRAKAVLSGNIIKNAKSVTVPGTGGLKGIEAAVAAGAAAGDATKGLELFLTCVPGDWDGVVAGWWVAFPCDIGTLASPGSMSPFS